jgi:hypothetical protein
MRFCGDGPAAVLARVMVWRNSLVLGMGGRGVGSRISAPTWIEQLFWSEIALMLGVHCRSDGKLTLRLAGPAAGLELSMPSISRQ